MAYAKREPALIFETESEAGVALSYYRTCYPNNRIEAVVSEVNAAPTHQLTNDGFQAVEMGPETLFG